jgi:hypothetical protein
MDEDVFYVMKSNCKIALLNTGNLFITHVIKILKIRKPLNRSPKGRSHLQKYIYDAQ